MHTPSRRRLLRHLFALAALAGTLTLSSVDALAAGGRVFTITNAPGGNTLLVHARNAAGVGPLVAQMPTGGVGTGAGLGSQGAVTLAGNGRHLFVVNAGSHTVSTFTLGPQGVTLVSVVDSGGLTPTSVTEHDGVVYVLNTGGAGNVAGFRNVDGMLLPIVDGVRPLSAAGGTAPAQVGFGPAGDVLVVSERATNRLVTYEVRSDGRLGAPQIHASAGITPFGFAFTQPGTLVVTEAAGGAALASTVSSYRFADAAPAVPLTVSAAVPTTQTAACWIAVTPSGRFAYAANAGSSSLSAYRVAGGGSISLIAPVAASTGAAAGALDVSITRDGRELHVLANRASEIQSYAIGADGRLTPLARTTVPAGSAGLASD